MLLTCAVGLALAVAQDTIVVLRHVRPSTMIERLNTLMPSAAVMTADDERGVILVHAGKDLAKQVKSLATQFDVERARLRLSIQIDSPIDHEKSEVTATVANNLPWRLVDSATKVDLAMTPRINSDGSVTLLLRSEYGGSIMEMSVRVSQNRPQVIRLGRSGGIVEPTLATEMNRLQWPSITISAKPLQSK